MEAPTALSARATSAGAGAEVPSAAEAAVAARGANAPLPSKWRPREVVTQGWIGAASYDFEQAGGARAAVDEDATMPVIGGGAQWKLAGDHIDFGVEGLLGFAWSGNTAAIATGGGGAVVAVDVDLYAFELFGGPFVSAFLGDGVRMYAGAGPVMQWASYEQDGPDAVSSGDGSGFGIGYYARAGVEFAIATRTMLGFCVRWTDTEVDLNGGFGDLEVRGVQGLLTVTQGF